MTIEITFSLSTTSHTFLTNEVLPHRLGEIIKIHGVNIYDGHNLKCEINLEFDSEGNVIPYDKSDKGSHCHYWHKDPVDGLLKRKKHDKSNIFAIDGKYDSLIKKIEKFNKENHK